MTDTTVYSMTGFGSGRVEAVLEDQSQLTVAAEVKTVNHKHLQAKIRLPHDFAALEPAIDKLVRQKLSRGAVQLAVDVARSGGDAGLTLNGRVARRYMELQRELLTELAEFELRPIQGAVELIRLPGVIEQTGGSGGAVDPGGPEAQAVLEAVGASLDALLQMRAVEGSAMGRDLAQSGDGIRAVVAQIEERIPEVVERHRARLVERVAELSDNPATTAADLAREIALLSDRLDVSEEISRLASHIAQLDGLLQGGGAIGRKLDFLAQEFFREANTIGAKCSDAGVAHLVVDLKTHVERLREQVQNVE